MKWSFLAGDFPEEGESRAALLQRGKIQKIRVVERTDSLGTLFLPGISLSSLQTLYFKILISLH